MSAKSVFHAGEKAIQERLGVQDQIEKIGNRIVRDFMPDMHRELFEKLPWLFVGARDPQGRPWASVASGAPGFVETPDARTLRIDARPWPDKVASGGALGILGIELGTRRRNRANGVVARSDESGFVVDVAQSFGNCPKYIQARTPLEARHATSEPDVPLGAIVTGDALDSIQRADTFFIATTTPDTGGAAPEGVDVSHRGGKPGFVKVTEEGGHTVLTSPDFVGNFLFNTLGNLALDPRAGLLFVDFDNGHLVSLTGEASVVWEGPELDAFEGAERLLRFRVSEGLMKRGGLAWTWSPAVFAPDLARLGAWPETKSRRA